MGGSESGNQSNKSSNSKASSRKIKNFRNSIQHPEVSDLDESSSSRMSKRLNSIENSEGKGMKRVSQFKNKNSMISNKRLFMDNDDFKMSSKKLSRYEEIGAYGFLRGDGTVPLVSELMACGVRNDTQLEVYERLKFFAKECFRSKKSKDIVFLKI